MSLKDFGDAAQGLSKGPLGIISLFILLVYGFACLVLSVGGGALQYSYERLPIVLFLISFPFAVLYVFYRLVTEFHRNLYPPSEFKDETLWLEAAGIADLPTIHQQPAAARGLPQDQGREDDRQGRYAVHRGVFLSHIITPSAATPDKFDIFFFLVRHKPDKFGVPADFSDIGGVQFYLGPDWSHTVFEGQRIAERNNTFGLRVTAYGPFLCVCTVTFEDGQQLVLEHYVDFEVGRFVKDLMGK